MEKRADYIQLIGKAAMAIKQLVTKEEFDQIQKAHGIAYGNDFFGAFDDDEMFNYEQVVRIIAEDNDLTYLTDPILNNLER